MISDLLLPGWNEKIVTAIGTTQAVPFAPPLSQPYPAFLTHIIRGDPNGPSWVSEGSKLPLEGAQELSTGSKSLREHGWASLRSKIDPVGADAERSGSSHGVSRGTLECFLEPSASRQHRNLTDRNRSRLAKA